LNKSKDTLIENVSSESYPVKSYWSPTKTVFGFKNTLVSNNNLKFLILRKQDGTIFKITFRIARGTTQTSDIIYQQSICVRQIRCSKDDQGFSL
jgi:hypothetical protein